MTPEQFTKGRSEFIKACKNAPLNEALGAVYDLDMMCDALAQQNASLNEDILSLKSALLAATEELRSNGREMPHKMGTELTALARKDAEGLDEKSRANLQAAINLGVLTNRKAQTKNAINCRHDRKGGSRDLKAQIQEIWASGKYTSRELCAEEEYAALGFKTLRTARDALIGTPDPNHWQAKEQKANAKGKIE